jgi:hypothetical protein
MSCFNKVSTVTANSDLDLTKHVNYTSGMILGVDDFTQEFAYLAGRDRWLARDALGFGTISGLQIQVDKEGGKGARVMVLPGVAISPRGQFICVSTAQCAYLNEWLAANDDELEEFFKPAITSPPTAPPKKDNLTLYVVLCYRDCPVDNVPIPGEPCRSEDDLLAPSRIQDDFSLELRLQAPKQSEEQKVREYAEWLKHIKVVETGDSTTLKDFKKAVRAKWLPVTSPPTIAPPPGDLQINVRDVCVYMRTAFRLWVTELRSVLSGRKTGCSVEMTGGGELEDCVLLAELRVPLVSVSTGLKVSDSKDVVVEEENRPFLLHLRMLQEWIMCNFAHVSGAPAPVTSPPLPPPLSLDELSDVEISNEPADGQFLLFDGSKWVNKKVETGGSGVTDHGNLVGLGDDDHKQYLLIDGKRAMQESLDAGGFRVKNLKVAENAGEAVTFEQAIKRDDEASGDLSGKYPGPTIAKLQGKVLDANPTNGQVLIFRRDRWVAENLPAPTTTTGGVTDHGNLNGLRDDDHPQYLLVDGNRAMTGSLNLGNRQITNLALATANNQAVAFQQAIKDGDKAGGDLSGTYPSPTITMLQGKPVKADAPNTGDMLVWNGSTWSPQAQPQIPPPTTAARPELLLPLATITRVGAEVNIFEIWFNIDAPDNSAEIEKLNEKQVSVVGEDENRAVDPTSHPEAFLTQIPILPQAGVPGILRTTRNVFRVVLRKEMPLMRFRFNISQIDVSVSGGAAVKLDKFAAEANIRFAGQIPDRRGVVTIFVRGR